MIWENFKLAFASIRSAKLRSFLTMLGIIIGIAAVVSISAIGEGVKKSVTNQITGLGTNVISITSGKSVTTSKDGKKTGINPSASIGASTLTSKDLDTVQHAAHIVVAAPLMLISGVVQHGQNQTDGGFTVATTPDFNRAHEGKLDQGSFLVAANNDQNVAVLGSAARDDLFGKDARALGQDITVRGVPFRVIGVLASEDSGASSLGGGGFDSIVYLPVGAATKLTGSNLQILRIFAKADDAANVTPTVTDLKTKLLDNHGGQEDFSVLTQKDLVATVGSVLDLLATFIAAIAAIALLVGGIGIMNIMLVSVTERTREIGIRKALGASSRIVLTQFLIEAVVISLLGGVLGIAAAYGLSTVAGRLIKITPVLTTHIILLAAGVSIGIGIVFGIAPAIKAARKRPIEALRYE